MRETSPAPSSRSMPARLVRAAVHLVWTLLKRVYALALVVLVLWLSWKAFFYLVSALMLPARPPPQIVDVPTLLDQKTLVRSDMSFAGVRATEHPRTPLSHYHRLETWYQPDPLNGCTQQGCHVPMPHGKNKADRAFLNMHATSIQCGVCHMKSDRSPLELVWVDLKTGEPSDVPALLQAYTWLNVRSRLDNVPFQEEEQDQILALLRAAVRQADGDPVLTNLADHLAAVRVQSDEFRKLLDLALKTVPKHFRGEYGAKLTLVDPDTGAPMLNYPGSEPSVREFLEHKDSLGKEELDGLLKRIHPEQREKTLICSQCHRSEGSLLDLRAAGYPIERIEIVMQPLVMMAIEHIVEGQPFYIPNFTGFSGEPRRGSPSEGGFPQEGAKEERSDATP